MEAPGRNDTCPCGSGKKYKKCCLKEAGAQSSAPLPSPKAANAPAHSPAGQAAILREIDRLVLLFNSGNHAGLENHARLMIKKYPEAGIAWKFLGASLLVQGKDALPALQKAAEILPADFEVHNNLGVALHNLGKFEPAAASFRRALLIKPDYAEAYNNLGDRKSVV
jgi:tetratricopeptide (TPR) repeat protein